MKSFEKGVYSIKKALTGTSLTSLTCRLLETHSLCLIDDVTQRGLILLRAANSGAFVVRGDVGQIVRWHLRYIVKSCAIKEWT